MTRSIRRRVALGVLTLVLAVTAGVSRADPPTRVIRLSYLSGAVSFSAGGTDEWVGAALNRPIVQGDRLWVDDGARSELALANATVWLGPQTDVRVLDLQGRFAQLEVAQGSLVVAVRTLVSGGSVEIDTPNVAFVITRPGRYRVAVDDQGESTLVGVRDGRAEVYGGSASYVVSRGQSYRFYGDDLQDSETVAAAPPDPLERFAQDRDRRFARGASARFVSSEVIGYEDLDQYGAWDRVGDYGDVWFPRDVARDWAPYREGHWSWIDPWGWTWVDDAPWGFAPFHYGRWVHADRGWGWVPGPANVAPVYAPALVAFIGGGGVSVSVTSGPAIGWFPLGPREIYRPPYQASREYFRQVNVTNTVINNVTVINNAYSNPASITQANYVNLRAPNAVTAVPPAVMAQAQPVNRARVQLPANVLDKSQIRALAKIAPAQQAIVGASAPSQNKPPARVDTRPVVARTAPPPPPMPIAQKIELLQRDPGKPIERPVAPSAAPSGAPATRAAPGAPAAGGAPPANVRVVQPSKPAPTAAPPAKAPDAARARSERPTTPAGAPGAPGAAVPPRPVPGQPAATPASPGTAPGAPVTRPGSAAPGRPGDSAPGAPRPSAGAGEPAKAGGPVAPAPSAGPSGSVSPGAPPRPAGAPPAGEAGPGSRNGPSVERTPPSPAGNRPEAGPMPRNERPVEPAAGRAGPATPPVPAQPAPAERARVPATPPPVAAPPVPSRPAERELQRPASPPAAAVPQAPVRPAERELQRPTSPPAAAVPPASTPRPAERELQRPASPPAAAAPPAPVRPAERELQRAPPRPPEPPASAPPRAPEARPVPPPAAARAPEPRAVPPTPPPPPPRVAPAPPRPEPPPQAQRGPQPKPAPAAEKGGDKKDEKKDEKKDADK